MSDYLMGSGLHAPQARKATITSEALRLPELRRAATCEGQLWGISVPTELTGSNAFIEPERKPSRSSVTYEKPSALKIRVSSVAISMVIARGNSSRAISIRAISP